MKIDPKKILASRPRYFRTPTSHTSSLWIEPKGGIHEAGRIRGASVVTRGEALGHGLWLDSEFISQTHEAINASELGIKSRFTHPSLSADGLGTHLGRAMDAKRVGDQVLADLHFATVGHNSPGKGDLVRYVMQLADEDPLAFGLSIVYDADIDAEREFFVEHGGKIIEDPDFGELWDNEEFESPDPLNTKNLIHARLLELRAVDFVDEPAANAGGLFTREQDIAQQADALANYALGLSSDRPETVQLGLDADRVKGFVSRFLSNHKLSIVKSNEASMTTEQDEVTTETIETSTVATETATETPVEEQSTQEEQVAEPVAASDSRAEAARFRAAFGDRGLAWFCDGLSFDQARDREVEELKAEVAELRQKLAARSSDGELEPIGFDVTDQPKRQGFASKIRIKSR
jgi:hypothetical protein